MSTLSPIALNRDLERILSGRHHAPHAVLGRGDDGRLIAHLPGVREAFIDGVAMLRIADTSLFAAAGGCAPSNPPIVIETRDANGAARRIVDPYSLPLQLGDLDLHLIGEGKHLRPYRVLGANPRTVLGIGGLLFATWAPNAQSVSVVGDFNGWDDVAHPMSARGESGVWELFVPELGAGQCYKFALFPRDGGAPQLKTDPYGKAFELRPGTAALTTTESSYPWRDGDWLAARAQRDWRRTPMSIYEVHLGSWRRADDGGFLSYRELAALLIPYVRELGFTHIQLLPITEHPLDASWGYQTTGYFAPTSRFGDADGLRAFVDACHDAGLGIIVDWVPAHFPKDAHALARYDGTALFEHADPRLGEHQDWGTLIFNYGRNEVRMFLIASALYWLEDFHCDGLRVDAVASMLYLDYSREPGQWLPNRYGGNENLDAIAFLRELNEVAHREHPGILVIAEESTAWPQVTRPTWLGGLGFSMKWNMGWMHDTLDYLSKDPVYRTYHHDRLTFGLLYAFTENFVLPLSHDEVVHEKGSLISKMPGDDWQRMANLRLMFAYMWTYPGKKLLFMGGEFGQYQEWNHDQSLDWDLAALPDHRGLARLVGDLNRLHRERPALYEHDFEDRGFAWIDCHDADNSVVNYLRIGGGEQLVICLNFTPVPRHGYSIGVPQAGRYIEILNSDSSLYGGSDVGNAGALESIPEAWMGQPNTLNLILPPLAAVVFRLEQD